MKFTRNQGFERIFRDLYIQLLSYELKFLITFSQDLNPDLNLEPHPDAISSLVLLWIRVKNMPIRLPDPLAGGQLAQPRGGQCGAGYLTAAPHPTPTIH
jgi:hypothetical protein